MYRLDLSGEWTLSKVGGKETVKAQLPGDTHSALIAAGKAADPYDRMNEAGLQWIGREDWVYSRDFTAGQELLSAEQVFLNLDVVDTVAKILVNGKLAGETDNMFVRVRLDVKPLLKKGSNKIEIAIKSPEREAIERSEKQPYPIPYTKFPIQSPHRNLVRKVACHAGWDWGPCLMVSGVYGAMYLQAAETGRIEYVYTEQRHSKGLCEVEVIFEIKSEKGGSTTLAANLGGVSASRDVMLKPGLNKESVTLKIKNPKLWWPKGFGEQYLYDLTAKACGDTVTKKLGLRTMELVSEEDKDGLSLLVRVNGVDVFCKGADWIPSDALPQRETVESIRDLLVSAVKANMNCLRVWGGGQYESDAFYGICDELGLLIWHDFMFSCSLYPADKKFLASVRLEAEHQVKRLRDFASIALWCGNNEDVGALNWYEESKKSRDRYLIDYDRLNEGVLGDTVDNFDPQRKFWPSSPCGGRGDYSDCWHNDSRGDMHYWEVWHGGKPFEQYYKIKPRFCSEFGFQSFPSMETIKTYAREEDLNIASPVMEHHQRGGSGANVRVLETMSRNFRIPEGFDNFVYLSQVQQGFAIKTATEHWRRLRPYCMGTIYWQLNDNWPVCSWASLEYGGKWKLMHYMATRFFADVMVVGIKTEDGGFEVHAVNDLLKDVAGKLTVNFIDLNGKTAKSVKEDVKVKKASAKMLKVFKASDVPFKPDEGFVRIELSTDGGDAFNDVFLTTWKSMSLPKADVKVSVKALDGGKFEVEATTDKPAFFFSLDVAGVKGEFDANCLTLVPGQKAKFVFEPKQRTTLKQVKDSLSFKHLRLTYK